MCLVRIMMTMNAANLNLPQTASPSTTALPKGESHPSTSHLVHNSILFSEHNNLQFFYMIFASTTIAGPNLSATPAINEELNHCG